MMEEAEKEEKMLWLWLWRQRKVPWAKECSWLLAAGRVKEKVLSYSFQKECSLADFWAPKLYDNKMCVVLSYHICGALLQQQQETNIGYIMDLKPTVFIYRLDAKCERESGMTLRVCGGAAGRIVCPLLRWGRPTRVTKKPHQPGCALSALTIYQRLRQAQLVIWFLCCHHPFLNFPEEFHTLSAASSISTSSVFSDGSRQHRAAWY